jgi:hypothetical protein
MVELRAERVNARNRLRRKHVRKVAYVIGRLGGKVLNPLGAQHKREKRQNRCQKRQKNWPMCAPEGCHRFLLYVGGWRKVPALAGSKLRRK